MRCPVFSQLTDDVYISPKKPNIVDHSIDWIINDIALLELCHVSAIVSAYNESDATPTTHSMNQ